MGFDDDELVVLDEATELFGDALDRGLEGDCLACAGWSRRECANHVIGGALRYAAYFHKRPREHGADPEWIAWSREHDHSGDHPRAAHLAASRTLREEFVATVDTESPVPHRLETITVRDFHALRVFELVVHAHDLRPEVWDSERAASLASWTLGHADSVVETMWKHDVLAPVPSVSESAGPRTRLLALAGRTG